MTLRGLGGEMIRSDQIRGAKRFPAITADLREPLDPSAAGTAPDSTNSLEDPITTWWTSISVFFDDVIACGGSGAHLRVFPHRRTTAAHRYSERRCETGRPASVAQRELREHFDFAQKGYLL